MADNSGNSFKDNADSILNSLTGLGESAAKIYSTFMGAKSTYTLAQAQKADAQRSSSFSPEQEDIFNLGKGAITYVVYGAIALAILGTGVLIYKTAKKR